MELIEDLAVKACANPRDEGFKLAMRYLFPEDSPRDVLRAIHWFAYAARAGNHRAMRYFDWLYGSGFGVYCVQRGFWFEREIVEKREIKPTEVFSVKPMTLSNLDFPSVRRVVEMARYSPGGECCHEGNMIEKKPELFEEIDVAGEDSYWYFPDADWVCNKSKWDDMLICDHLNECEKDVQCVRVSRGKIVCDTIADVLNAIKILPVELNVGNEIYECCIEPTHVRVVDEVSGELNYIPAHYAKYDGGDCEGATPRATFETRYMGIRFRYSTLSDTWRVIDYGPYESVKHDSQNLVSELCEQVGCVAACNTKMRFRDDMSKDEERFEIQHELEDTGFEWFYFDIDGREDILMGWKSGMSKPDVNELLSAERMAEELLSNAEAIDRDASFDEDGLNVSYEVELLWDEA